MAVTGIDSTASTTTTSTKADAFSSLNSEQFIKIIFSELSNQDPLKPNDSSQLVQQMANLRSIQSDIDLQKKLTSLVTENQLASAGNMIGQYISGLDDTNTRTEGFVASVSRTANGPILNLQSGARVPMSRIDEVVDPRYVTQTGRPINGG